MPAELAGRPPLGHWPKLPQEGATETPWVSTPVSHMPQEPLRRAQGNWEAEPLPPSASPLSPLLVELTWRQLEGETYRESQQDKGGWIWSQEAGRCNWHTGLYTRL